MSKQKAVFLVAFFVMYLVTSSAVLAFVRVEQAKLTASDPSPLALFGTDAAISGNIAVFGAPNANGGKGAAYIFQQDDAGNWVEVKKLEAGDGSWGDAFGASVAIDGDIIVVAARFDDDAGDLSGSAYIFRRNAGGANNWGEVAKITASDATMDNQFGWGVGIVGETIAIGARGNQNYQGAVYVFQPNTPGNDNWHEIAKLTANNTYLFGEELAINDNFLVIAAPNSRAVYIFQKIGVTTWEQVKVLTISDGNVFGMSVAIDEDWVAVGGGEPTVLGGKIYIFERNTGGPDNWGHVETLTADDMTPFDFFGISVSLKENWLLVGATQVGIGPGLAYLFQYTDGNWIEVDQLLASDGKTGDFLGHWVALGQDVALVSAPSEGTNGSRTGAVYVYRLDITEFPVSIDIKPGDNHNRIYYRSQQPIPVAILSTTTFDAPTAVLRDFLTFGRTGFEESLLYQNDSPACFSRDVNGDTLFDLVCYFSGARTDFQPGDTAGTLLGQTAEGIPFRGHDVIQIVNRR